MVLDISWPCDGVEWPPKSGFGSQFMHDEALVRLYLPGMHCVQFTAPVRLKVPASQAEQLELPAIFVAVPSVQCWHALWPEADCDFPTSHALHEVEPIAAATLPASHAVQVEAPDEIT